MSMGSIMYLNKPCSQAPIIDNALDSQSNRAIKNGALTQSLKAIVGIEIGSVSSDSTGAGTGKTLVEFTNTNISDTSELHLIADNGAGSSNDANTSSYDTPVFYNSVSIDSSNHTVTYEFNDSTLIQYTDFYLRIINASL